MLRTDMRALKAALKVLVGLALGLGVAELVFRSRDDGAFPHLNLYVEDAALGVALAPNGETRVKLGANPTTTVRTNALGFRGADWPAAGTGDVLVVGDSQVFGLGVEETETFSARLSELRKVTVLNAGVPTYGPHEYTTLVERLVETRKPAHVIYVLNVSNDLFELGRPNTTRHRVWDGWAVRSETAPAGALTPFPFRHEVMNRSHLMYAARRFVAGTANLGQEAASEGTWTDVIAAGASTKPLVVDDAETRKTLQLRASLTKALDDLQRELAQHLSERISEDDAYAEASKVLPPLQQGDPRDIVQVPFLEGARSVEVTAHQLYAAALGIDANEARLLGLAKKMKDPELEALLTRRRTLRSEMGPAVGASGKHEASPLEQMLKRTRDACDKVGARLLVVALPLDVMVSADEWKKYGKPAMDLSATKVLLDDIVARAEAVGASGLDPTSALAKAEPGAFLDGDLHLTPKGHAALAAALMTALDAPPPKPKSALVLPEGRSWPPTSDEWRQVPEVTVKGSTAANCDTRQVREWFRMECRDTEAHEGEPLRIAGITVLSGGHGEVVEGRTRNHWVMLPVLEGDTVTMRVDWTEQHRTLTLEHPVGAPAKRAFTEPEKHPKMNRGRLTNLSDQGEPCAGGWCEIDWANPLRPVSCPAGMTLGGALRRCSKACDASTPCATGSTCHPWPTGDFCQSP